MRLKSRSHFFSKIESKLIESKKSRIATTLIMTHHSSSEKSLLVLRIKTESFVATPASFEIFSQFEMAHGKVEMTCKNKSFLLVSVFTSQRFLVLEVVHDPLVVPHGDPVLPGLQRK